MSDKDLDQQFDLAIRKDDALDAKLFEPPRWKGGPVICHQANLPAFSSRELALAWLSAPNKTNPQYEVRHVEKIWQCDFCKWWHMDIKPRDPAGSSSGQGRSSKA